MKVEGLTPILNVSDIKESFSWFEKLGWEKRWDWGDPPSFGAVGNGRCEIFLCVNCQGSRGKPGSKSGWDNDSGGVWMSWWVESPAAVDAVYQLALQQGITVTVPPANMEWNVREFYLRHPDGHTFRVGAGIGEE